MPAGISVEDDGASLRLVRRWFSLKLIPLLFFCIAWDAFLVFWYSLALAPSTSMNGGGVPWIMIVFPIAHVAVGVGLTYSTLAGFLNRTQVRLEPGRLSIRHGPLPWLGNQVLDSSELDQVFCRRRDSTGRHGTNVTYEVRAIMKGGKLIKLLSGLEDEDQALYLEQQIERRLGIADRAVPGELEP